MAYRKSSWRKLKPSEVLPLWTPAHTSIAQLGFQAVMQKLGITDISSYWHRLRVWIVASVIVCILVGASNYGLKGVFLGGLLGLFAPAALLLLGVTLVVVVVYLAVYCIAVVVIYSIAWWF